MFLPVTAQCRAPDLPALVPPAEVAAHGPATTLALFVRTCRCGEEHPGCTCFPEVPRQRGKAGTLQLLQPVLHRCHPAARGRHQKRRRVRSGASIPCRVPARGRQRDDPPWGAAGREGGRHGTPTPAGWQGKAEPGLGESEPRSSPQPENMNNSANICGAGAGEPSQGSSRPLAGRPQHLQQKRGPLSTLGDPARTWGGCSPAPRFWGSPVLSASKLHRAGGGARAGCRRVPAMPRGGGGAAGPCQPARRSWPGADARPWPGWPNLPGAGSLAGGEEMPA